MFDYLIVGAGFAGSVLAERLASQLNKKVLVIEKRTHIGGNAYDRYNDDGLLIHQYGPHIFHTNSAAVVEYLSQFTGGVPINIGCSRALMGNWCPCPLIWIRSIHFIASI